MSDRIPNEELGARTRIVWRDGMTRRCYCPESDILTSVNETADATSSSRVASTATPRRIEHLIRCAAVGVGILLLTSSAIELTAVLPYSTAVPPLSARLLKSCSLAALGVPLTIRYRHLRSRASRTVASVGIMSTVLWAVTISVSAIAEYSRAEKNWQVVPAAVGLLIVIVCNAGVFVRAVRRTWLS